MIFLNWERGWIVDWNQICFWMFSYVPSLDALVFPSLCSHMFSPVFSCVLRYAGCHGVGGGGVVIRKRFGPRAPRNHFSTTKTLQFYFYYCFYNSPPTHLPYCSAFLDCTWKMQSLAMLWAQCNGAMASTVDTQRNNLFRCWLNCT